MITSRMFLQDANKSIFLFNITSVPLAIFSSIIRGIGMSPFYGVQYSLPSDGMEYGQWKTGKRIEGLMFSSMSFWTKSGTRDYQIPRFKDVTFLWSYNGIARNERLSRRRQPSQSSGRNPVCADCGVDRNAINALCYKLDKTYKEMIAELTVKNCQENLGSSRKR